MKEEIKEEQPKAKPRAKPKASDIVNCDKCDKAMTYKNPGYSHNCDPKPVKKQANPKPKAKPKPTHEVLSGQRKPKPPPEIYYSESGEEEVIVRRKKKHQPPPQPINPQTALSQHYQLLQQAMVKQKQERYNNLCMNMFSTKTKKR